jgi:cell shape-determining protein MreC
MSRVPLPTKSTTFALLMAASAILALLPSSVTRGIRGLVQPFVFLQQPASALVRQSREAAEHLLVPISPEEARRAIEELESLKRERAQRQIRYEDLEEKFEEVSNLRGVLKDRNSRILLTSVISFDADPGRETIQIGRGRFDGLREGMWVAAAEREPPAEGATGWDLLTRSWLVGRVVEVLPQTARVQLTTDPNFKMLVLTARQMPNGAWQRGTRECYMIGRGAGQMLLSEVEYNYHEAGHRVVLAPADRNLPAPLTLGRIENSRPVDDAPQHFNMTVTPWGDVRKLRHVYVIVPG